MTAHETDMWELAPHEVDMLQEPINLNVDPAQAD